MKLTVPASFASLTPFAIRASVAALILALSVAPAVHAQDSGPSVSGNVTFTSDYVFRGISQALEDPAVQGGFDIEAGGFYIGTWGSNVDFGSAAHVELDVYLGYTQEYDSGFSWDLGAIQYLYPSESDLDTLEVYFGIGLAGFGLTASFTDEYFGVETDAVYADLSYETSFSDNLGVAFHVGQSTFDDGSGLEDYIDYSVTLSTSGAGVDFALGFHATDIDDFELADDRVVFSISKTL